MLFCFPAALLGYFSAVLLGGDPATTASTGTRTDLDPNGLPSVPRAVLIIKPSCNPKFGALASKSQFSCRQYLNIQTGTRHMPGICLVRKQRLRRYMPGMPNIDIFMEKLKTGIRQAYSCHMT